MSDTGKKTSKYNISDLPFELASAFAPPFSWYHFWVSEESKKKWDEAMECLKGYKAESVYIDESKFLPLSDNLLETDEDVFALIKWAGGD